jgi:hypothetical protein
MFGVDVRDNFKDLCESVEDGVDGFFRRWRRRRRKRFVLLHRSGNRW